MEELQWLHWQAMAATPHKDCIEIIWLQKKHEEKE